MSPYRRQKRLAAKLKILPSNYFELQYIQNHLISNPLLRDKKVLFNPRKAWKILAQFNLANRAAGAEKSKPTLWLGLLDKIRTFFQKNPDADL